MPNAVDTNVLIRFIVDDGKEQVAVARRVFSERPVFLSLSVMLESEWVLRSSFGFDRSQICDAFDRILGFESVVVQETKIVEGAVESYRFGMDFADALHLHSAAKCDVFYTFDKKLARKAKRTTDLPPARSPQVP